MNYREDRNPRFNNNDRKFPKKQRLLKLLPHRKYRSKNGTMVRVRQAPDLPKQCVILCNFDNKELIPTHYDADKKLLFLAAGEFPVTVFSSKLSAKRARWHSVAQADYPVQFSMYKIVLVEDLLP